MCAHGHPSTNYIHSCSTSYCKIKSNFQKSFFTSFFLFTAAFSSAVPNIPVGNTSGVSGCGAPSNPILLACATNCSWKLSFQRNALPRLERTWKRKKKRKKKERKMKIRRQRTENNISHIYSHIQPFILMHPKKKSSLTCLTTSRTVICSCSINSAATSTPLRLMPAVQCTRQFLCLSVTAFHLLIWSITVF